MVKLLFPQESTVINPASQQLAEIKGSVQQNAFSVFRQRQKVPKTTNMQKVNIVKPNIWHIKLSVYSVT